MSDKKYVTILIGAVLSIITVLYLLVLFLPEERYMDEDYPFWMQQRDYISSKGTKQEILLLGNSRMLLGVLHTELSDNTYNLSLGGATPIEMYYPLNTYLKHHPAPKTVTVAFGPLQFATTGFYTTRNLYFHYFDDTTVEAVNKIIYELNGRDFSFESNLYKFRSPNVYMEPILKSSINPKTLKNREIYENTRKGKGWISHKNDYGEVKGDV